MNVYYINPILTIGNNLYAEAFYKESFKEMEEHIEVVGVKSNTVMLSLNVSKGDYILFFNRSDDNYGIEFSKFLESSINNTDNIYPIAISTNYRKPPKWVSKKQSFDVFDSLKQRSLTEAHIATVAYR